jgi:hypothetical protein
LKLLSDATLASDDDLAHVISSHGRRSDVVNLELQEFCDVITDLTRRPVVLDAAIESVLRSKRRAGVEPERAASELRRRFPAIADEIDAAVVLGSLLGSDSHLATTTGTGDAGTRVAELPELPFNIGPQLANGERRYGVRERVAAGEQGSVYLAVDRALSETGVASFVAVKLFHTAPSGSARDRAASSEAVRARQVSHRNVAMALDRGVTDAGLAYSVFEYVEGGSLQDMIKSRPEPLTPTQAAKLLISVARGVQAIHVAGILHRDLKPGNVLMTRSGEPKVTDFGLAFNQLLPQADASQLSLAGTLGFAAPEQFALGSVLNSTCDTYALGGMLLFMLTGCAANGKSVAEASERLGNIHEKGPVNPTLITLVKNHTLAAICTRATDRDPALRYQSAEALASDLERWLRNEPLLWLPTPRMRAIVRWMRREWISVGVGAAALVTAVSAALYVVDASHREALATERAVVAGQQKQNADLHRQLQTQKINSFRKSLRDMLDTLKKVDAAELSDGWLAQVAVFEGAFGPNIFGNDTDGQPLWIHRIERAKAIAADLRSRNAGPSAVALQWDFLAGFWMLTAERYQDARVQFARVVPAALANLRDNDGLVDLIEKLNAAAIILVARDPKAAPPVSEAERSAAVAVLNRPDSPETAKGSAGVQKIMTLAREALSEADVQASRGQPR